MNEYENRICPICGATLIDDAWDIVEETDTGFIVDAFNAWVCEKRCGYFERQ